MRLCCESWLALLLGSVFGITAVCFVPPVITFDAPSHYFRARQISESRIRAEKYSDRAVGGELPTADIKFVNGLWASYWGEQKLGTRATWKELSSRASEISGRSRVEFTNTAVYSPANYAFQALGIGLCRSPLSASRLGCLLNLAGYLTLVVAAIELLPHFRKGALLLATSPLIVIQAASLSADAVNFALPLLVIAGVWRLRAAGTPARSRDLAVLLGLGLVVVLLKPIDVVVLACLWLIPSRCFRSASAKAVVLASYFLCAAALWLVWNRPYLSVDVAGWFYRDRPPLSVQRDWFLGDPRRFLQPFGYFLRHSLFPQWTYLYGSVTGWVSPQVRQQVDWMSYIMLAGLLGCASWKEKTDWTWAVGSLIQAFGLMTAIAFTLWLRFGTVTTGEIPGFQGRYLMLTAFGVFAACAEVWHTRLSRIRAGVFWLALGANAYALAAMLIPITFRTA